MKWHKQTHTVKEGDFFSFFLQTIGSNIPRPNTRDRALPKVSQTPLSENIIRRALNITPGKIVCSLIRQNRVLVPRKLTSIVSLLRTISTERNGLASFAKCVFDVDVVECEIGFFHAKGAAKVVGAGLRGGEAGRDCYLVDVKGLFSKAL